MISQANRHPGHATYLSDIRSKPFAPVFTFQIRLSDIPHLRPQVHFSYYTILYAVYQQKVCPDLEPMSSFDKGLHARYTKVRFDLAGVVTNEETVEPVRLH